MVGPEKKEECGVVAIFSKKGEEVAPYIYRALISLQHRGQDAAGFVVWDGKKLIQKRGMGLVSEIFKEEDLKARGLVGIGHTRYPTTEGFDINDAQPFLFKNIAVANNGHVANHDQIKQSLKSDGYDITCTVESELMAKVLAKNKTALVGATEILNTFDGAYSSVVLMGRDLVVFRDKHAIRPLVYGENDRFVCFASESAALDINNIPYCGNVLGGEIIIVRDGKVERTTVIQSPPRHCMFEYVYFSRPDSIINDLSVYAARKRLGEALGKEHPVKADVIIPVPDTSRTAAEAFSKVTNIPVAEGLIKNRYVGRTFIMPTQKRRADAVKLKLNTINEVIAGKRIVLIDDSIVRGTTLREIVKLVKRAGPREVHVRITCPPIKAPCFYGVDMSTYEELIANNKTIEEIRKFLDVDSLGYLSILGLKKAIGLPVCTGCLDEDYPTGYAKEIAKQKKSDSCGCG